MSTAKKESAETKANKAMLNNKSGLKSPAIDKSKVVDEKALKAKHQAEAKKALADAKQLAFDKLIAPLKKAREEEAVVGSRSLTLAIASGEALIAVYAKAETMKPKPTKKSIHEATGFTNKMTPLRYVKLAENKELVKDCVGVIEALILIDTGSTDKPAPRDKGIKELTVEIERVLRRMAKQGIDTTEVLDELIGKAENGEYEPSEEAA